MRAYLALLLLCLGPTLSANTEALKKPMRRITRGFMENKGQVVDQEYRPNTAVRFLWQGERYNVQLRHTGFSYDHYQSDALPMDTLSPFQHDLRPDTIASPPRPYHFHRVDVELLGMHMDYGVETLESLTDHMNFYTAGTPYGGATHVQHFKVVRYTEVYRGIDIEFMLDPVLGFKYNVIAAPGADLDQVRMRINGPWAQHLEDGSVVMRTRFGEVRETVPYSYWRTPEGEVPVEVGFVELGDHMYGLKTRSQAAPPAAAALVVDPQPYMEWATYFGGPGNEVSFYWANGMEAIQNDELVGAVYTGSPGLATAGSFETDLLAANDLLVYCFNSTGGLNWATYIGGDAQNAGSTTFMDLDETLPGRVTLVGRSHASFLQIDSLMLNPWNNDANGLLIHFSTADGTALGGHLFGGMGSDTYLSVDGDATGGYWVLAHTVLANAGTPGSFDEDGPGVCIRRFNAMGSLEWATYVYDSLPWFHMGTISATATGGLWFLDEDGLYGYLNPTGTMCESWNAPFTSQVYNYQSVCAIDDSSCIVHGDYVGGTLPVTPDALQGEPWYGATNPSNNNAGFLMELDRNGSIVYSTNLGIMVAMINKEDSGGYAVSVLDDGLSIGPTPFADPVGNNCIARFTRDHMLMWCSYYERGSYRNFAHAPGSNAYWVPVNADDYADSTSYQPDFGGGLSDAGIGKMTACTPNALPALGQISGPGYSMCNNVAQTYTVAPVPGVSYYRWQAPSMGQVISGQGTPTAQIVGGPMAGFIRVMAMDSCGIGPVSVLPITAPIPASVTIDPNVTQYVCPGDSVRLDALGVGFMEWTNGDTGVYTWANSTGNYGVTATSISGCTATASQVYVSVVPFVPFTVTGPTLVALNDTTTYSVPSNTSYIAQEWEVLNSGTIVGDSTLLSVDVHWTSLGNHQLVIHRTHNLAQCVFDLSTTVQVTNTIGMAELDGHTFNVFPNPASDLLTLAPGGPWASGTRYQVQNTLGQVVATGALPAGSAQPIPLRTQGWSAGVYTVRVVRDGAVVGAQRVVVE